MDATRISDNTVVSLKRIKRDIHPHEVEIALYFSTEPLASHPRNHCVPIYEVLDVPDDENEVIIVMPFLREYNDPRFKSVGEAVEFFRQIFEVRESGYIQTWLPAGNHRSTGLTVHASESCSPPVSTFMYEFFLLFRVDN